MSIEDCPNPQPDCKYAPECFSDTDHTIPQRLGETALQSAYLDLPELKEQVCRRLHDERNARHDRGDLSDVPEFPDEVTMREAILEAAAEGLIYLSRRKKKRFGL